MTHYKLRITLLNCSGEEATALVKKQSSDKYAICYEKGKQNEKPHLHCYLITKIKEDTLRTQIRKLSKSSRGNKLYSLKLLDVQENNTVATEYLAYMMKEGKFTHHSFTDDEIQGAKEYDETVKQEMKEKKEKRKSRFERITKAYVEADIKFPDMGGIIRFVYDFFLQENCNVSVSTLESWSNTLAMRYLPEHRDEIAFLIAKRLTI